MARTTPNRSLIWLAAVPTAVVAIAAAVAEPPEGPPGDRPRGPADRLRAALDANGDHELDEGELENAAAALRSLDENGNGRIDRQEFRPPMPPPPPRRVADRVGPEGRPPRAGGEFRRPRDGERPTGPPGERPRRERPDGPPRERLERPAREGGPRGPEPGERPSPERFVERAMSFDTDGDGKLDREELGRFAEEMMARMRAGMAERLRGGGPPRRGPPDSE
jgi:hypothetical protein